jgi:hypothetical protein
MISNASLALAQSEERREEIYNYAMVVFLRIPELEISIKNFEMITHLYCISLCNGFGIADTQMLRIGTGLYYPSVSTQNLNSCNSLNIELSEPLLCSQLHLSFSQ